MKSKELEIAVKRGWISKKQALKTKSIQRYGFIRCEICGEEINTKTKSKKKRLSIDHIVPKSRGGSNDIDNLQLSHCKCNSDKNNDLSEAHRKNIKKLKVYKESLLTTSILCVIV